MPTLQSDSIHDAAHLADALAERGALSGKRINQFNISLDFLDERYDQARESGLGAKIMRTIPRMRESNPGIRSARDQRDNLTSCPDRKRRASWVASTSAATPTPERPPTGFEQPDASRDVMRESPCIQKTRGVITNSDYYLEQIPRYVRGEITEPCRSGMRTVHIDPLGRVKRCPDFPTDFHWTEYRKYEPINCNACFYACRGEAQAPLRASRILDIMASPKPLLTCVTVTQRKLRELRLLLPVPRVA